MQAVDRTVFRLGVLATLAFASVFAGAQVAPSRAKASLKAPQSVMPGAPKAAGHQPDAKESKSLLERRAIRTRGYIENKGQWPSDVKFMGRTTGLDLFVTSEGLRMNSYLRSDSRVQGHVIGVKFLGSKGLSPIGKDEVGVKTDFFDAKKSGLGARTFRTVESSKLYPNILLKNYYDQGRPRYDFVVAPHGNPSQIKMKFISATGLTVSPQKLSIKTSIGSVVQNKLAAYQLINGKRKPVTVAFHQIDKTTVGFKLGAYDHNKQLIIDPLVYGSYYGGDSGMDEVHAVVSDLLGGVYMTGSTMSPDFPVIFGPYSFTLSGEKDAFMAKLEGDAYRHDYAAYFGGNKEDTGDFLQLDQFGNLWVAGYTSSPNFPGQTISSNVQYITYDPFGSEGRGPTGGARTFNSSPNGAARFRFALPGKPFSAYVPWNVTPGALQTAIQTYLNANQPGQTVQVNGLGNSSIVEGSGYRVTFSAGVVGELFIDSYFLGAVYSVDREAFGRAQVIRRGLTAPNAGAYTISAQYSRGGGTFIATTDPIPFAATAAVVDGALHSMNPDPADPNTSLVALNVQVKVATQAGGGQLPGTPYILLFTTPQPTVTVNQGTMNQPYLVGPTGVDDFYWNTNSSTPAGPTPGFPPPEPDPTLNGGAWNLAFGGTFTNPSIRYNTTALQLHDAIGSIQAITGNNVVVIPDNPGAPTMPAGRMAAVYVGGLLGGFPGTPVTFDDPVIVGSVFGATPPTVRAAGRTDPRPIYTVHTEAKCFVMRFKQDTNTILSPLPTKSYVFGGAVPPVLSSFRIIPHDNPVAGEAIRMAFGGTSYDPTQWVPEVPSTPRGIAPVGFILRVNFTDAGGFSVVNGPTKYIDAYDSTIGESFPIILGGIDVDSTGNIYVGGTIRGDFGNTTDTSQMTSNNDFIFQTTPVDSTGTLRDGRLLRFWDGFARKYNSTGALSYSVLVGGDAADEGFGIAVDSNNDAYLLGRSRSFNYPRTRGVFGEQFTQNLVSTVAKLNPSASDLIYCTHLRTSGTVTPVGITVDPRGVAYMTFMISRGTIFNEWTPANDPNLNTGYEVAGSIPTASALVGAYNQVGPPDYGGTDGALIALNPSATNILFGSYLGSTLDDVVYRPFVDKGGDVWICGYTDTFRAYIRPAKWKIAVYRAQVLTRLPASMLTNLAFRPVPDPNIGIGGSGTSFVDYQVYNTELDWDPKFWQTFRDRDGYVDRLRIGLASVAAVGFNPGTIAGGLGAASTGVVTLSQAAPAGGAVITLSMAASAPASFDAVNTVSNTSITIPAGGTQGAFTVYSRPVSDNTPVDVTATYQGNFKVGRLVVTPWLQAFSVTPSEVVGGNGVVGKVTLAATAGALGVTVQVTSDNTNVVPVTNVTVPAGQTSAAFNITTNGVDTDTTVTLNASLLGVGKPFQLIVHPAQLKALTFAPNPVTSKSSSTGTLVLSGKPGTTGFSVDLSVEGSPAGYTLTPSTLTFGPGETSKSFVITTPYESATVNRVVDAQMLASAGYTPNLVKGTLSVAADSVTALTITPNPAEGGTIALGQVTLTTAALAGGAKVDLSVSPDNGTVTVPGQVTVLQGQTAVKFNVPTTTTVDDQTFVVTASRGSSVQTTNFVVKGLTFTLSIPDTIASGSTATGTVTLSGKAPAGGIAVHLSSDDIVLSVPDTVPIPAGQTSVTFPLNPSNVTDDHVVHVTATIGSKSVSATTTIHASQLVGMTLTPSYVLNLQTVRCTIALDGPAPAGGLVVNMTSTNAAIASVPAQITIPAGQSSISFSFATRRVTRTLSTVITATAVNGGVDSKTLIVHN